MPAPRDGTRDAERGDGSRSAPAADASPDDPSSFAARLLAWWDVHGRRDLPWQHPRTPYRVWLSEVMLQQTQVATVIPYFARFLAAFPDLRALAAAPLADVLAAWSGLGYYSRARNLHRAAQRCVAHHGGELPDTLDALAALPGIGRSTAGAILAQAHGRRVPILDGNVKRVLTRWRAIEGDIGASAVQRTLWALAESLLPTQRLADYTQAIMDLGATLCVRRAPRCGDCPLAADCAARRTDRQHALPTTRGTRAVPTRRIGMALLQDPRGRVLLERRPARGVWGGLLSLPEFVSDEDPAHALAARGLHATDWRALPAFVHAFSHFRLEVAPHAARLDAAAARAAEPSIPPFDPGDRAHVGDPPPAEAAATATLWVGADDLHRHGLPAPIRSLLERHFAQVTPEGESR